MDSQRGPASRTRRDTRFAGIDLLRGLAIAMMVAYHFCYDLAYFGFASWRPDDMLIDRGWIAWRNLIVSSFLLLVGLSRVLSAEFKPSPPDFWKRWGQIAAAAALVSIASYGFAGDRWIYFGILHFVALALLLSWLVLRRVRSALWVFAAAVMALLAGVLVSTPALDPTPLNILGFAAHKPRTEDYVPLFPWIGVVLVGLASGLLWKSRDFAPLPALNRLAALIPLPLQRVLGGAGRWSLTIYLVHQPILIGVFTLVAGVLRTNHPQ